MLDEEDAKGFARKVVTYAKGKNETEDKVVLRTDVHFGYARNKGDARFHHTFHQDIIMLYKKGKVHGHVARTLQHMSLIWQLHMSLMWRHMSLIWQGHACAPNMAGDACLCRVARR